MTAGGWNIDNIVNAEGELKLQQVGGNGFYSSLAVANWVGKVYTVGNIPANYPDCWLRKLNKIGVDTRGVKRKKENVNYQEWFFYRENGSREEFLFMKKESLPEIFKEKNYVNEKEKNLLIKKTSKNVSEALTFSSFRTKHPIKTDQIDNEVFPLQGCHIAPNSFQVQLNLCRYLHKRTKIITLDPGLYEKGVKEEDIREIFNYVDIFLPSEKELRSMYPNKKITEAIKRIPKGNLKAVVLKLGSQGCLVYNVRDNKFYKIEALQVEKISDLTGAGDVFCGGYLVGFYETENPIKAALYGTVTAAKRIERNFPFDFAEINRNYLEKNLGKPRIFNLKC